MKKSYLEKTNSDGSKKFWSIWVDGLYVTRTWGKVGASGQNKRESFGTTQDAEDFYEKILAMKIREGYEMVTQSTPGAFTLAAAHVLYVSKEMPDRPVRDDVNFSDGDLWLVTSRSGAWYPAQEFQLGGDDKLYKWTPTGVTLFSGFLAIRGFRITKMDEDWIAQADAGWTGEIYDLREGIPKPNPIRPAAAAPDPVRQLSEVETRSNVFLKLIECQCSPPATDKHLPWCHYGDVVWPAVEQAIYDHLHDVGYARHPHPSASGSDMYEWLDPDCKQVYVGGGELIPPAVLDHYRANEAWS